jgi:hypothetical protein
MQPRRGVTLTEVLVAIFVCGLGLMALMTLFPLGALNMAQAVKDDRAGHCAANATANLRMLWRVGLQSGTMDPTLQANLNNGPVYLDPLGFSIYGAASLPGGIPRSTFPGVGFIQAERWCTLLDDMDFNPDGTPIILGTEVSRQGRYTWAWMIRWLNQGLEQPPARALEFAVVVYQNRPQNLNAAGLPAGEYPYPGANFIPPNAVSINYTAPNRPVIKKTGWILDATPGTGYFYRVESVQDTGSQLILTTQNPLRGWAGPGLGTVVYMENVVEVFERSTLE